MIAVTDQTNNSAVTLHHSSRFKLLLWFVFSDAVDESSVKLIGGIRNASLAYGKLMVHHAGVWGSVCGSGFSYSSSLLFCRLLGYT
jgi:hypothetical protein